MFWKTCLTHAGEILLALGGAWVLGYLWNRWFGSNTDSRINNEYEDQIQTLRDRIKLQDQEIKAGLIKQDSWNAELSDLQESNLDLKNQLTAANASYLEFISPSDHQSLQAKQDFELKLKQDQIATLMRERDTQSQHITSLEARLKSLQQVSDETIHTEAKLISFESDIKQAALDKKKLEQQLMELTNHWNDIKNQQDALSITKGKEFSDLQEKWETVNAKNQELTQIIQQLKEQLLEKDNTIQQHTKNSERFDQNYLEQEKKSQDLVSSKDLEINRLQTALKELEQTDPATLDHLKKELADSHSLINGLQAQLHQFTNQGLADQESGKLAAQKLQEIQIYNQQLANDLQAAKSEVISMNDKLKVAGDLEKHILELNTKSNEWEARWKDAATEAEQFKVAHNSLVKERDGQRQHLAQLESDILHFNTVFKEIENKEIVSTNQQLDIQNELANTKTQYEEKLNAAQRILNDTQLQLEQHQKTIDGFASIETEWLKKQEDLQHHLIGVQDQLASTQLLKDKQQAALLDWEQKFNSSQSELAEAQNKLKAIQFDATVPARREAEWDAILKSKEDELRKAQQTIAELTFSNESKLNTLNDLEHRMKDIETTWSVTQNYLEEAQKMKEEHQTAISTFEHKNEELHHELQLTKYQLAELNQQKESHSAALNNLEHRNMEVQSLLEANKLREAANEKNTQVMETLVGEWEKKYYLLQKELHTVNLQLSENQRLQDSQITAKEDLEQQIADLQSALATVQVQFEEFKNQQGLQNNDIDDWEAKYNELNHRYNIVQLQFADTQRVKSHLEADIRKSADYQAKYQSETKAWEKRFAEMESDFTHRLALLKNRHSKELIPQKKRSVQSAPSDQMITQPALNPVQPLAANNPQAIKLKATVTPKVTAPDFKIASEVMHKKITADDHKIIEGIGPKISNLLRRNKIKTWSALSLMPVKNIQNILNKSGDKFKLAVPKTWPAQAKLAASGKWEALKKLQDDLKLNKKSSGKKPAKATHVKVRKKALSKAQVKPIVVPKPKPAKIKLSSSKKIFGKELILNDLKVVEGIGPKIEKLLHHAKIESWSILANTNLKSLKEILKKAGPEFNMADPKSWAAQAYLASKGQWKRLKSLQDNLIAGK